MRGGRVLKKFRFTRLGLKDDFSVERNVFLGVGVEMETQTKRLGPVRILDSCLLYPIRH